MVLQSCRITITNQQVMISQSVEAEINNGISKVKIHASDGLQVRSYTVDSAEEPIESFMSL